MSEVFNKYKGTIIGIAFITAGMLFFLIMEIFQIWTRPRIAGPTGFCEYYDPNLLIGEPMNAWSNFYFVGAGMSILIYYDLLRMEKLNRRDVYIHRDENMHYIVSYGLLVIWVGIASFYMHASYALTPWFSAGFLDVLSMNMYMSGLFIMSLAILFDIKKRNLYIILLIDFILVVILMKIHLPLISLGGGGLFEVLLVIAIINEVLIGLGIYSRVFKYKGARQIKRNFLILAIVVITFVVSYWLWHFGKRNAPTCDPHSWWQWHAVWHFLNACAMLLIGLFIQFEREIEIS